MNQAEQLALWESQQRDSHRTFNLLDIVRAACTIDCEGYIGITMQRPNPRTEPSRRAFQVIPLVKVTMTDVTIPVWLAETFGGYLRADPPRKPGQSGYASWMVQREKAAAFCKVIVDQLMIKRSQAELVMAYYEDPRVAVHERRWKGRFIDPCVLEARREYVTEIKRLNHRGGLVTEKGRY
jgi:hypothetical protein